jgi:hypothetical protein
MLCITLTAAALVAAGAAFAQEAPEGNRVEINGMLISTTSIWGDRGPPHLRCASRLAEGFSNDYD